MSGDPVDESKHDYGGGGYGEEVEKMKHMISGKNKLTNGEENQQRQQFVLAAQSHELPQDLWIDCLSRLDVQSLVQFRCVSIAMKSLVQSSSFCKSYLTKCTKNMTLLAYPAKDVWKYVPCERETQPEFNLIERNDIAFDIKFKGVEEPIISCNGIICLGRIFIMPPNKMKQRRSIPPKHLLQFTFMNPATRDFGKPSPELVLPLGAEKGIHVAFGFSADNVHKVVVMDQITGWACMLYRMEFRNWIEIGDFPGIPCGALDNPYGKFTIKNVHINGAIHWLATKLSMLCLVSLDLERETFETISLPEEVRTLDLNNEGVRIGCLGEKVGFSYFRNKSLFVWRLKAGNNWELLAKISTDAFPADTNVLPRNAFKCFNIVENLNVIIIQNHGRLFKRLRHMIYYDIKSETVVGFHLVRFKGEAGPAIWIDEANYIRSLFTPK